MLSEQQRELIEALRKNSREKLTVLAKKLDVPLSTLHDRLYKLVRDKHIRLVSIPDYAQLHRPLQAWVFIKAKDRDITRNFLEKQLQINTLLAVNNGADFAAQAVFAHFKEYDEFLCECRRYGSVKAHPIIEAVCVETARVASSE